MRRHAFSLIELLVVIAIVAILAGMLMPVLRQVQEAARAMVCGGALRQFGCAFEAYGLDNEGFLPPTSAAGLGFTRGWWDFVIPYLEVREQGNVYSKADQRLLWCPAARRITDAAGTVQGMHYGPNPNIWSFGGGQWGMRSVACPRPSSYILLAEINANRESVGYTTAVAANPRFVGNQLTAYRISHQAGGNGGRSNYLFADYHLERLSGDIGTVPDAANLQRYWRWW
ncbi:MAG: type II secretion system GspH family protein [Planctomycetes bacterium]|nr:type II secretion system GspH family protein [Planctomycetota bacterium]